MIKLLRKIKSIIPTYQKHGIDGIIYALLKNFKINSKFVSIIDKKKYYIEKKIIKITNRTVISGLYKSTKINCKTHWKGFDNSSKLLGLYEKQVQEKAVKLKEKFGLKYLVNFGSGDGYHILGLLKNNYFEKALAFEKNSFGRDQIVYNSNLNNLDKKIIVFGDANFSEIEKNLDKEQLKKSLFIVDIEGAEFEIFNNKNFNIYKNSVLIIENHDFYKDKKLVDNFFSFMNKNFDLEILENGARNPHYIKELKDFDDDEKWLIVSENRPQTMNWLVFTPKNDE